MKDLLIAVDFDGTITQRDTLHVIVEAFGAAGVWGTLEPRLRRGELSLEAAMERQFADVRAPAEDVRDVVLRESPVREGFAEFVEWTRAAGHELLVLSNGFRAIIDAVLGAAGISDLEIVSHDARFGPDGCRLIWSDRGKPCAVCGRPCKRHDLRMRWDDEALVYVGDGISDRCVAVLADRIFARAGLAAYLDEQGVEYTPFDDFHEVRRELGTSTTAAAR